MKRLPVWLSALWWGSLTTIGFVVAPLLFAHLPTPALAGNMAARLFTAQTWIGLCCGLLLLMYSRSRWVDERLDWSASLMALVVAAMLCALLAEFVVAPRIVARDNLRWWHAVGTGLYGLQWLLAASLLWKFSRVHPSA